MLQIQGKIRTKIVALVRSFIGVITKVKLYFRLDEQFDINRFHVVVYSWVSQYLVACSQRIL